jgi:hypothetical protein
MREPAKNRKEIPGDDGKTVADMNVEGMPWYVPKRRNDPEEPETEPYRMNREEFRAFKWAAVKAGLLIALVFGTVFGLFIAFCDFIWFK